MRKAPVYLALLGLSLLFLFPFYWVAVSSLKSVAGINLEPPSMIPAEQLTTSMQVATKNRIVSAEGASWLVLVPSRDLLGTSLEGGAYCLQVTDGKPTKLVEWLGNLAMKPKAWPQPTLLLEDVPVNLIKGQRLAVPAKMVRQTPSGFDELLFTSTLVGQVPHPLHRLETLRNVPHEDIRHLSVHWDNFAKALRGPEASIGSQPTGFLLFMRNSLMISLLAVVGQVLSSSLVAYGFARLRFRGRELLFIVLLATLMVPAQVTLIPLFTIYKSLGWIDSFLPLIVPQFTAGAFNVFLVRQFMVGLPRELDESAEIDGATPFRIFRSIVLPNCTPVLIVVALFTFVAAWQDVMGPLIYLDNPAYRTVSLGLEYFRSPYVDNRPLLMAGALLSMLPVAAIFLVAQRHILAGIATTGMKG